MKNLSELLQELASKFLELIRNEEDFDKRELLLQEHQKQHDALAQEK